MAKKYEFPEELRLVTDEPIEDETKSVNEARFVEAVKKASSNLVADFQGQPGNFRNERDMHCALFHYLKQEYFLERNYYGTELVHAEFPTHAKYGEKRTARGHYDLVILDPNSATNVRGLPPWTTWDMYLPLVEVTVAIEVKMWVNRADFHNKVDWDIKKLTDPKKPVKHPYYLNFVQLDFSRQKMRDHYRAFQKYLIDQARYWSKLRILCVPNDREIQLEPRQNWLSGD